METLAFEHKAIDRSCSADAQTQTSRLRLLLEIDRFQRLYMMYRWFGVCRGEILTRIESRLSIDTQSDLAERLDQNFHRVHSGRFPAGFADIDFLPLKLSDIRLDCIESRN